jgi:hypothetical protein
LINVTGYLESPSRLSVTLGFIVAQKDETLSGGLRVSEETHKRIVPTEDVD